MISVLILTMNEERNICACLEAVSWSDDVVVLDSGSTDKTLEIARSMGARILERPFDDENTHRSYSIHKIKFKYPWVYNPDADEITTPALRDEMLAAVNTSQFVAYRVRFKTMFMGRWIRYASLYPTWVVRLFRPERISFSRNINLQYHVDGLEGRLEAHFEHHTFNNGFNAWFDKHNRYSWKEAQETVKSLDLGFQWKHLILGNQVVRRKALKELSFRLPGRPLLRFIYMYFVKLGFLDGVRGWLYCCMLSVYEFMIVLKVRELKRRCSGKGI